jgi:hypothetical protein
MRVTVLSSLHALCRVPTEANSGVQEEAYIHPSLFCLSNVNPVRVVMIKLEQYDRHQTVFTHARANPARVVPNSVAPPTPVTAVTFFTT